MQKSVRRAIATGAFLVIAGCSTMWAMIKEETRSINCDVYDWRKQYADDPSTDTDHVVIMYPGLPAIQQNPWKKPFEKFYKSIQKTVDRKFLKGARKKHVDIISVSDGYARIKALNKDNPVLLIVKDHNQSLIGTIRATKNGFPDNLQADEYNNLARMNSLIDILKSPSKKPEAEAPKSILSMPARGQVPPNKMEKIREIEKELEDYANTLTRQRSWSSNTTPAEREAINLARGEQRGFLGAIEAPPYDNIITTGVNNLNFIASKLQNITLLADDATNEAVLPIFIDGRKGLIHLISQAFTGNDSQNADARQCYRDNKIDYNKAFTTLKTIFEEVGGTANAWDKVAQAIAEIPTFETADKDLFEAKSLNIRESEASNKEREMVKKITQLGINLETNDLSTKNYLLSRIEDKDIVVPASIQTEANAYGAFVEKLTSAEKDILRNYLTKKWFTE